LLAIAPLLFLGLALTNDFHHGLWLNSPAPSSVPLLFGPVIPLMMIYSYSLVIINIAVYGWLMLKSPDNRWPAAFMLSGTLAARILYLMTQLKWVQTTLPLNVISIGLIYLAFAIALFFFSIFDPTKLARQQVITQMRAGMLALDSSGRIVHLNPAAQHLLGVTEKFALGRLLQELLPAGTGFTGDSLKDPSQREICLEEEGEVRRYSLSASTLEDWRGVPAGHLLLLYDITELKQAQAQLVEQGRTLAALEERQNLARDLHDSTSQALSYIGFQIDAARQLYRSGQGAKAEVQLARLAMILQDAHADIREFILNLRTGISPEQALFPALQQYLENFALQNEIEAHLTIYPSASESCLDWQASTQVFRIVQEALSNARKHAKAKKIEVTLEDVHDRLRVMTQDDGCGFDVQQTIQANQFGFVFMRERAAKLGGCLSIQSAPGTGTRVILEIPHSDLRL
jgi:PAS domain S-box-containing protein